MMGKERFGMDPSHSCETSRKTEEPSGKQWLCLNVDGKKLEVDELRAGKS